MTKVSDLPRLEFERDGIRIASRNWTYNDGKSSRSITTLLKLAEFKPSSLYEVNDIIGWNLRIKRPVREIEGTGKFGSTKTIISRAFMALVWYNAVPDGHEEVITTVMRGECKTWEDAIREVQLLAGRAIIDHMRQHSPIKPGPEGWTHVRPFTVKYPFKDAEEPNAKYSPFVLPKFARFDHESLGETMMCYGWDESFIRQYAEKLGCNAFLVGPNEEGKYQIAHRRGMMQKDDIDLDDWRGRIIAGTTADDTY